MPRPRAMCGHALAGVALRVGRVQRVGALGCSRRRGGPCRPTSTMSTWPVEHGWGGPHKSRCRPPRRLAERRNKGQRTESREAGVLHVHVTTWERLVTCPVSRRKRRPLPDGTSTLCIRGPVVWAAGCGSASRSRVVARTPGCDAPVASHCRTIAPRVDRDRAGGACPGYRPSSTAPPPDRSPGAAPRHPSTVTGPTSAVADRGSVDPGLRLIGPARPAARHP